MRRNTLTPKQEAFAQAYVETGNACEAYRCAYNAANMKQASIEVEASRLLNYPKVALRIKELRESLAVRHAITREQIVHEVYSIYQRSRQPLPVFDSKGNLRRYKPNLSAALSALRLIAVMQGWIGKRREVKQQNQPVELTTDEAQAILARWDIIKASPVVEGEFTQMDTE